MSSSGGSRSKPAAKKQRKPSTSVAQGSGEQEAAPESAAATKPRKRLRGSGVPCPRCKRRETKVTSSELTNTLVQIEDPNYPHDNQPVVRKTVRRRYWECLLCGHRFRTSGPAER